MAMTDVMDDVDYKNVDFNNLDDVNGLCVQYGCNSYNHSNDPGNHGSGIRGHPLWLTDGHFVYHLYRDGGGQLGLVKDKFGQLVTSPRKLCELCQYEMVHQPSFLESLRLNAVPSDLYPRLLTESILQSQLRSVALLVSSWPFHYLHVKSMIPLEESISSDYMTAPVEGSDNMSLMDAIAIGLLNHKPHAKLRVIDFTGFSSDRRLCRELLRLPIVWMKPKERQAGFLHSLLRKSLVINKEKVQRYLHKIACIYSNTDLQVRHGHKFGPITIILDCQMTVDDVPIGLALQAHTPFNYVCQRAWYEYLPEVGLSLHLLSQLIPLRHLTHLQIEDREMCANPSRWISLLECLLLFPSLQALSLPNTVHATLLPSAPTQLSSALASSINLRKVNLASCSLSGCLSDLLCPPTFHLTYLCLRDARLTSSDLHHLIQWHGITNLRELNLSRNNLGSASLSVSSLLPRMKHISCFAVSYCSLCEQGIRLIVRFALDSDNLKVLCLQSFIPPPFSEIRAILEDCSQISSLQKCVLLPEAYAFPGSHISERADNHERMVMLCGELLQQLGRSDIQLE